MGKAAKKAAGANRSASETLRGFEYQLYRSVLEWLQLTQEDQLYLETGEDILRVRQGNCRYDQVKDQKTMASLGRSDILQSLGHFLSYRGNGVRATFRFITTGGVVGERGEPFGKGICGINVWRRAAAASHTGAAEDVRKIRDFLLKREKLPDAVREFLQTATLEVIHRDLIVPFDWITHEPKSEAVMQQAKALLVQIARDGFHVPAIEAEQLFPRFVTEVLEVAARRPEKALTREKISEIVSLQAYRLLTGSQMQDAFAGFLENFGQSGESRFFIAARVTQEPPPVPEGYVRRKHIFSALQEVFLRSSVAVIVGSVGMGKSALAKDVASQDGIYWRWANLRNMDAKELLMRLDRIEQDVFARPEISKLVLDDAEFSNAPLSIVDGLSRIVRVLRARNGGLLITTSGDPSVRILQALAISAQDVIRIGSYQTDEITDIIVENFGKIEQLERAADILRVITYGHPTLVAARLHRMNQTSLSIGDLLQDEKPPEVRDVEREIRSSVKQLDIEARNLLYRMSIAIVPLKREEALELASREPMIAEPGIALDRIVGPWLEVADLSGKLRRSPLVSNLAREVLGGEAETRIEQNLVEVLLQRQTLGSDDLSGIVFHALHSRHEQAVGMLLASLLQQDEKTISWAAGCAGFLIRWGIDEEVAGFGRNVQLILRALQFRMATALGDDEASEKIGKAFERDFPPGKENNIDRFRFFGYVVSYGKKPIAQRTKDALRWAESAAGVMVPSKEIAGPHTEIKLGEIAVTLVIGHIASYEDLDAFMAVIQEESVDVQRRFLGCLSDKISVLRGLFSKLQFTEFNRDQPRWGSLVASVQCFHNFLRKADLNDVAIHGADEAARLHADQLRDPDHALALIAEAEALYPSRAELLSARAFVCFQKKEYEKALEMWDRALSDLPKEREDFQPSQDARYAGIAAGKLQRFMDAERWLSWAGARLSKNYFQVPRVVYGFDAAFAAWKGKRDAFVLSKLAELIPMLQSLNDSDNDLAFGAFKRIGHVLAWMANDRDSLLNFQYHEPEIGAISSLENVPRSAVPSTPLNYIIGEACEFEFQTQLGSQLYDAYMTKKTSDVPASLRLRGCKLAAAWSLRRCEFEAYAERVVAIGAMLKEGNAPHSSDFVNSLAMLGLIAALSNGTTDAVLVEWANAFGRSGYRDTESKILRAVGMRDLTGDLSLQLLIMAQDSNTSGAYETRMLAAIVHGTNLQVKPSTLLVCVHYWIDATQHSAADVGTGEVLLRAVEDRLQAMLSSAFRHTTTEERMFVLENCLNGLEKPWKKLYLLLDSLANASDSITPLEIEQFLQNRMEEERRWFDVR